jgi:hypothetical protein
VAAIKKVRHDGRSLSCAAYAGGMQLRDRQGLFMAFAAAVILVPGLSLYAVLRAVGLGIGAAGVLGLLLMFVSLFAFCGWAFSGLHRG